MISQFSFVPFLSIIGGEDALALKLECVIDACSNASITSVTHENSCLVPHTKKDLMSKVTLIEKNPCQVRRAAFEELLC